MFGIGISELVLIAIIALIVVGPKNLPVTLRAIGRAIGEFRRATRELRNEVGLDQVVDEVTKPLREGMASIEADVRKLEADVRRMHAPDGPSEYPEGGPDDYGALPESAVMYPVAKPVKPVTPVVRVPERTVARGASAKHDEDA